MELSRVLDSSICPTLATYRERGGIEALEKARLLEPSEIISEIALAGLRGRGGAGFPTAVKWETVAANSSSDVGTRVVINAAEGEPGTFKDRTLLRRNPYKVLEGALIAAHVLNAIQVLVVTKQTFNEEIERLDRAIGELEAAGVVESGVVSIVLGPTSYLFGEETALLEVVEGRQPFPRIAPPYRRGIADGGEGPSDADLAVPGPGGGPPTLVNNVETFANIPHIIRDGASDFRAVGTEESPGTVICTISGDTARHAVAEIELGTTLREAITQLGGGMVDEGEIVAFASGVSNPIMPGEYVDTPLTYEAMAQIGSGLGTAGFIVFGDQSDIVSVAQGMARFLSVESCGQCVPCKEDGLSIAGLLGDLRDSNADDETINQLSLLTERVTDESRCYLAQQEQNIGRSVLAHFPDELAVRMGENADSVSPTLIAPIIDLKDGHAVLDQRQSSKQPDWTHDEIDSGKFPAQRLANSPVDELP